MYQVRKMNTAKIAKDEIAMFLQNLELFKGCSKTSIDAIIQSTHSQKISKGHYLFFQTDPAEELFIIRSGMIAIILSSVDGRELVINVLHEPDYFGELSLITGQTRSTSAMAKIETEVLVIPRKTFMSVLDNELCLTRRILETTARRLSASSERESALAFLDAEARLARILLQQDQREFEKGYVTISQEELAQHAGLTRQTVAKTLGRWRRAGWLLTGRGRIMLLNHAALQDVEKRYDY
jgi:CRP/FNR family transcriptional regulator, cyclic AMP receptor protein